jgi:hypothetical protein
MRKKQQFAPPKIHTNIKSSPAHAATYRCHIALLKFYVANHQSTSEWREGRRIGGNWNWYWGTYGVTSRQTSIVVFGEGMYLEV